MKRPPIWALGLWVFLLSVAWVVSFALYYSSGRVLPMGPPAILFLVVGAVLMARVRGNLIGPLDLAYPAAALLAVLGGVSLLIRFRTSGPEQGQQFKWLAATVVLAALLAFLFIRVFPGPTDLVLVLAVSAFPLAVGAAVLRCRLYELDRLISRTVAYTIVVVLLGVLFALAVVVVPNLLGGEEAPPWLVATATLMDAAAFNPLRRWILGVFDRRFNRSHYDVGQMMDAFATSPRDGVDADSVLHGWMGVVSGTMQPSSLGVWVRR